MDVSGGCEATMTARARLGCVKFRECGTLNGKRFSEDEKKGLSELQEICNAVWK